MKAMLAATVILLIVTVEVSNQGRNVTLTLQAIPTYLSTRWQNNKLALRVFQKKVIPVPRYGKWYNDFQSELKLVQIKLAETKQTKKHSTVS